MQNVIYMKIVQKFFNFLFSWKIGVLLQIALTIFAGCYYKIGASSITVFALIGAICYSVAMLLGMGIIHSFLGLFKKDGKKFMWIYLPFLILEFIRCSVELRTAYIHNKPVDIFVSIVYTFAFGHTSIALAYFISTTKIVSTPTRALLKMRNYLK